MPKSVIAGSCGRVISNFLRSYHITFKVIVQVYTPTNNGRVFPFSTFSRAWAIRCVLILTILTGIISNLTVILILFPWWLKMLSISWSFPYSFEILLLRIVRLYLYHILKLDCLACKYLVSWVFLSLAISPLADVELVKNFSHSVGCPFVLLTVSFSLQKFFSFLRSHLLIGVLQAFVIGVLLRKLSPLPMHSRLFINFSSISSSVSGFMLKSLIHTDLNFASTWILLHLNLQ